MVAHAVSRR